MLLIFKTAIFHSAIGTNKIGSVVVKIQEKFEDIKGVIRSRKL